MKLDNLTNKIQNLKQKMNQKVQSYEQELDEAISLIDDDLKPKKIKEKKVKVIKGNLNLEESAPVGSFEYLKEIITEQFDLQNPLGAEDKYSYYLMYVFPEKVICSYKNKYYEIQYTIGASESVIFDKAVEVEQYYVAKQEAVIESGKKTFAQEIKESNIEITKEAIDMDVDMDFFALREGSYNDSTGEVEVVLIEAGTNPMKKRHYPKSTIQECASEFKGLKMYINHQTTREDNERPERDLRDWVSTIIESWYEDGKAMAKVAVHDDWLRNRLKDSVARQHIGVSINAGGKVSHGKVNGEEMQVVEKIFLNGNNRLASVDWVTEAGARGRVSRLLKESNQPTKTETNTMDIKEAKFEDLQKENPKLLESVVEHIKKTLKESNELADKDKQLKEAQEKIKQFEVEKIKSEQKSKIQTWLNENAKIPQVVKERIAEGFANAEFETEEKLKECFDASVKKEMDYINKLSEKGKIKLSENSNNSNVRQSIQMDLEKRLGIKEEKKEE